MSTGVPGAIPVVPDPGAGSSGGLIGKIVAGVVVAAIVAWGVTTFLNQPPPLPDTVDGTSQMTGPEVDDLEAEMQGQLKDEGLKGDAAVYGTSDTPRFVLMSINAPGETLDEGWSQLTAGFTEGSDGGSVDESQMVTETLPDGDEMRCLPVSVPEATTSLSMCVWEMQGAIGFLLSIGGEDPADLMEVSKGARDGMLNA